MYVCVYTYIHIDVCKVMDTKKYKADLIRHISGNLRNEVCYKYHINSVYLYVHVYIHMLVYIYKMLEV